MPQKPDERCIRLAIVMGTGRMPDFLDRVAALLVAMSLLYVSVIAVLVGFAMFVQAHMGRAEAGTSLLIALASVGVAMAVARLLRRTAARRRSAADNSAAAMTSL
jgi:hypothetical protein